MQLFGKSLLRRCFPVNYFTELLTEGKWCQHKWSSHWKDFFHVCRSSHQRCSTKKGVLRNFTKFTGKHLCQGLCFNKVAGLRTAMWTINAGIWNVESYSTKQYYLRDIFRGFIFLFLHVFDSQAEASTILLIFFATLFTRSGRSLLAFTWRFEFFRFEFVTCCWNFVTA